MVVQGVHNTDDSSCTPGERCSKISLLLNGEVRSVEVRSAETLLQTLRLGLGLSGCKPGCENGDCGACTVLINDIPQKACLVLTAETDDMRITTIEGLHASPTARAFALCFAFQCGYCTPGFIMNVEGLLRSGCRVDEPTIQEWLESNICRCTSYEEIGRAVRMAEQRYAENGQGEDVSDDS